MCDLFAGRGDALGHNLVRVDRYLRALNPKLPVIQQDISLLAQQANKRAVPVAAATAAMIGLFLILMGVFINAPLEELANGNVTPVVAKAPWYFVGLQELLAYFHPTVAGVLAPTVILDTRAGMGAGLTGSCRSLAGRSLHPIAAPAGLVPADGPEPEAVLKVGQAVDVQLF